MLDVASSIPTPEKALRDLQRLVRRPPGTDAGTAVMRRRLPDELQTDPPQEVRLVANQAKGFKAAVAALLADLRFEHLDDAEDWVWSFVSECALHEGDHVPAFIERHQKESIDAVCYMPVEYLSVKSEVEALGIRLLPADDPRVPPSKPRPMFNLEKPVGSVAAAEARGTNYGRMADRATVVASHALRVLRITLRENHGIHDRQLRFRLGTGYAFDDRLGGFSQRNDVAYDLTLGDDLSLELSQPVADLPSQPRNDIERRALLALRWLDKAFLTADELEALLYRFYALEALLGDKAEGLKAHGLAFREMMLSHITTGGFRQPSITWFLYDKVRSGAVHGEEVPELSGRVTSGVEWSVRDVLNQYLSLAKKHGLTKRSQLLRLLDTHPDRPALVAWLRENGGPQWDKYLARLEWPQNGC
jgi:hypothetical protein